MTFKDEDLREEIEEMFAEEQARVPVVLALFNAPSWSNEVHKGSFVAPRLGHGMRVFRPGPNYPRQPETQKRILERRRDSLRRDLEDIRVRLLAGERPKIGSRGRKPTRWFQVAAELGIDLTATAPQPEPVTPRSTDAA